MKIIGAGLGRTGTKSLQEALEIIGYGPCYHMVTLFNHPHHIKVWEEAAENKGTDWNRFFNNFQSIVDYPGCFYYKQLMELYPDAKIILTIRDAEEWYKSNLATIYSFSPGLWGKIKLVLTAPFMNKSRNLLRIVKMNRRTIWNGLFQGRFEDEKHAIDTFNRHNQSVIETVPSERLLIFNVKDGWKPLCDFLEIEVPKVSFPKSNSRKDFHEMTRNFLSIS